jgi:AcrR family transcriptional regulator
VPRTRAPGRLNDIVEAAAEVFATRGYRLTRMQDVAAAAGVSSGLLYTYAAGKEGLFTLVIQAAAGVDLDTLPLPVPDPDERELEAIVRKTLRELRAPRLQAAQAATRRPADPRAELEGIVAEQYDGIHQMRRLLRVIERCALDWPELADLFFNRARKPHVRRLANYIERRAKWGCFRPVPDAEVAARVVIETVAWFANHRYGDYDGAKIPDDVARATVIEMLTNGLLAP